MFKNYLETKLNKLKDFLRLAFRSSSISVAFMNGVSCTMSGPEENIEDEVIAVRSLKNTADSNIELYFEVKRLYSKAESNKYKFENV